MVISNWKDTLVTIIYTKIIQTCKGWPYSYHGFADVWRSRQYIERLCSDSSEQHSEGSVSMRWFPVMGAVIMIRQEQVPTDPSRNQEHQAPQERHQAHSNVQVPLPIQGTGPHLKYTDKLLWSMYRAHLKKNIHMIIIQGTGPIWNTHNHNTGYRAHLNCTCKMIIIQGTGPIWNTQTNYYDPWTGHIWKKTIHMIIIQGTGPIWNTHNHNTGYRAHLNCTCKMIIIQGTGPIWNTQTNYYDPWTGHIWKKTIHMIIIQGTGPIWNTHNHNTGYRAHLNCTCKIIVIQGTGPIWNTHTHDYYPGYRAHLKYTYTWLISRVQGPIWNTLTNDYYPGRMAPSEIRGNHHSGCRS